MQPQSYTISGPKTAVEKFRQEFRAEFPGSEIEITEVQPDPSSRGGPIGDLVFHFAIHLTAGLVTHFVHDKVRSWITTRATTAQLQVKETTPKSGETTTTS